MVLGQAHLEDIVSGSESLQNILVVNQLILESLVSSFNWNFLSSPLSLEGSVVPVEELILSLANLLWNSLASLSVGL